MRGVKRLRVTGFGYEIEESENGHLVYAHDFDAQSAELAEARALLREIGQRCQFREMPGERTIDQWAERIDAWLERNPAT